MTNVIVSWVILDVILDRFENLKVADITESEHCLRPVKWITNDDWRFCGRIDTSNVVMISS